MDNLGREGDGREGTVDKDGLIPRREARLKAVVATLAMISMEGWGC